MVTTTVKMNEK